MAILTDPDFLSQGKSSGALSATFSNASGANVDIAATGIENLAVQYDYFEIRDHSEPLNNGLYWVNSTGTNTINAKKVAGDGLNTPQNASAEDIIILHDAGEAVQGDEKSVYIDYYNREIWILKQGQVTNDGATLQSIYSFLKEEWKNDDKLISHPFPFTAITPEQFEMISDWIFHEGVQASGDATNDIANEIETRKLVRTGGWREIGADNVLDKEYVGVITLGTFEDSINDNAYYQQGNDPTDTSSTTDFTFAGPVNEAILSYDYMPSDLGTISVSSGVITRGTGDWIADGYRKGGKLTVVASDTAADLGTNGVPRDYDITAITASAITVSPIGGAAAITDDATNSTFASAVNNRNVLNVFLRVRDGDPNGKTYAKSTLTDIGVDGDVDNKVFRFPVSNATDLKISETDANISTTTPYTQIRARYFDAVFTKDVDDPTGSNPRSFGIVIDVGTHSGIDGDTSGGASSVVTTAAAGINTSKGAGTYVGGTITIHNGTNKGTYAITAEADGQVTTSATLSSQSNMSFTLQRAVPIVATTIEIYEAIQYQLRQASDINFYGSATQNVVGKTADGLLTFVGDNLYSGTNNTATPSNPNGASFTGVIIEGFSTDDTNSLFFYDNTGTVRQYPFVAAGRINFNQNLIDDTDAKYWMYYEYTRRTTPTAAITATPTGRSVAFTGSGFLTDWTAGVYLNIQQFDPASNLNGIYRVTTGATTSAFTAYKISAPDGALTGVTSAGNDVYIDETPIDSPDALLVTDNSNNPITGNVNGQSFIIFDYDYNNENEGSRVAPGGGGTNDMSVIVRAIGFNTAQFVEATGTISRSTSIVISLVSALERNYSNAA